MKCSFAVAALHRLDPATRLLLPARPSPNSRVRIICVSPVFFSVIIYRTYPAVRMINALPLVSGLGLMRTVLLDIGE